jgi:hypothetical protein
MNRLKLKGLKVNGRLRFIANELRITTREDYREIRRLIQPGSKVRNCVRDVICFFGAGEFHQLINCIVVEPQALAVHLEKFAALRVVRAPEFFDSGRPSDYRRVQRIESVLC